MKCLFTQNLATASWGKGWFMKLGRLRLPPSSEREEDTEDSEENCTTPNAGLKDPSKRLSARIRWLRD